MGIKATRGPWPWELSLAFTLGGQSHFMVSGCLAAFRYAAWRRIFRKEARACLEARLERDEWTELLGLPDGGY